MNQLYKLTDRELLEQIYTLLQLILVKVNEIDNDEKQFGMNLAANLVGTVIDRNNEILQYKRTM